MKIDLILLLLCHQVISQQDTPPPNGDFECRFVNFTCEPGLKTTTRTFSQVEICAPIVRDPDVAGACTFVYSGGSPVAFKCPNTYGLKTSLLCIPPDVPNTVDYCFCEGLPKIHISEVPDIHFDGNATNVTENEGTLTVCAAAGELDKEFTPVKVTISTVSDTAQDGVDFIGVNQEFSFTESYQTHCVDVSILKDDGVDEVDEFFYLMLTLKYAPFDIPLDEYTVKIVDSDIVGIGFEQQRYSQVVTEHAGSVMICAVTNVTLNGSHTASGVIKTRDVSAEGKDYQALHQPIVFQVNGDSRACVNITIHDDNVRDEPHEMFVVELMSTDTPVFAGQAVVIILDNDQFYPFGSQEGDTELVTGSADTRNTSSKVTLTPKFRFFSNDEDTLWVNTNGVLSFKHRFHKTKPQRFPFKSPALISPHWEEHSTVRFGRVYYRITSDSKLLLRALYQLQDLFPSASLFFPSYLFIATWDRVPQLGTSAPGHARKLKHNTFQAVMATDGKMSFVFFIYHDIQWGTGGVGFNAGDGVRHFTESQDSGAFHRGGNVDIPGVYAYRVDLPTIITPGDCKGEGKVDDGEPVCKQQEVVQIGFEKTSYTVREGYSATVCAKLIAGTITTPVSVTLVTVDVASAHVGERYTKQETELIFDKTTQRACAEINIIDDGKEEEDESFLVLLVTIQTHLVSLNPRITSVTIKDYDGYGGAVFGKWLFGSIVIVVLFVVFYLRFTKEGSKESDKKKD